MADPHPWDGDTALEAIYSSGGMAVSAADSEIEAVTMDIGREEGIYAEPSGAAGLAGLVKLLDAGIIDPSDRIVVPITGAGFKDSGFFLEHRRISNPIPPDLTILERFL